MPKLLLKKKLSNSMEMSVLKNTSGENSSEKEDLPNAMSSLT
jgi:hypothetical protein